MPVIKKFLLFFILLIVISPNSVLAGCSISVSPSNVVMGSSSTSRFTVNNTGDSVVNWVRIQSPNLNAYSIAQMNAAGWYPNGGGNTANFAGGYLEGGASANFDLILAETGEVIGSMDWEALVSVDAGDNFESCGTTSIRIDPVPPTPTPVPIPTISSTNLSVGNNSASLSWNTSLTASGTVKYGTTTSYGTTISVASGTSHSATLASLLPSTTYHYQIQMIGAGGIVETNDATFTTSAASVTTVTTTVVTNTVTNTVTQTNIITPTPTPKPLVDTISPVVSISTDFSRPFLEAPTITGKSTDGGAVNIGVVAIEYSLDGGKNWLPVDTIDSVGKKAVTYEFTPVGLEDGNYALKTRAKDSTGNTGISKTYTVVIDRLPPQIGGSLFTLGPMIIKPSLDGNIYSLSHLPLRAIFSAVGGPTSINLNYNSQTFPLTKNLESGLWHGTLNLETTGSFPMVIKSIDGAKNETEKKLGSIISLLPGRIIDQKDQPLQKAKVSIYIFEKTENDFVLWDSKPYLQNNPQETGESGEYYLILPAGKYFIEVESIGKRMLRSEIFELDHSTPINQNFQLENQKISAWWSKTVPIQLQNPSATSLNTLVDKVTPDFDIKTPDFEFSNTSILGKPTILSFVSSWEPQTSDQLIALDEFRSDNNGINLVAVLVQESTSKANILKKVGHYSLDIIADPDGVLVKPLNLQSLPTHLFIDRKGIIKDIGIGFFDKNNLLKRILN